MASQPKAPDPNQQAQAQNSQNAYSAFYNSVAGNANTVNPYGSTTSKVSSYTPYYDPYTKKTTQVPQWTQTTNLSGTQQKLFDTENQVKQGMGNLANQQVGQLTDTLGKPFNTEGLNPWQTYGQGPDLRMEQGPTDRAAIEKAMMDSYYRGVKPQQEAQDAQLAARGQNPGGQMAYNVDNQRSDAAAEQTRQAYLGSGQESRAAMEAQNKALQQGWLNANARVDQGNAQRTSEFGERQQTRNQLVNEVAALMGGGQATIPNAPSWQGGTVNPFDIAGAQNQQYNIKAQQAANTNAGIFGALGNVVGAFNPLQRCSAEMAQSLLQLAQSMVGTHEGQAKLADYLHTGGQNLDPVSKAWCASFLNATLQQGGYGGTGSDLAKSFLDYGSKVDPTGVQPGDIAVYNRGANPQLGHAGLVQSYDPKTGMVTLISGNSGDAVSQEQRALADAVGYRRPTGAQSAMGPPANTQVTQYTPEQRRNAIASIESAGSGDYSALGVLIGDPEQGRDRAYGRYQIMGKNVPAWTKEVLGRSMSPQEFLADPKAQDAVFDAKFGSYVQKYGESGAAEAWLGGPNAVGQAPRVDPLGTTTASYSGKYLKALGAPAGATSAPGAATTQPGGSLAPPVAPAADPGARNSNDLMASLGGIAGVSDKVSSLPASTVAKIPASLTMAQPTQIADTSASEQLRAQLAQKMAALNSGKLWG